MQLWIEVEPIYSLLIIDEKWQTIIVSLIHINIVQEWDYRNAENAVATTMLSDK